MEQTVKNRKERIGWYFYDFANSAFTTSVITVFLGPFLTAIAKNAADASGNLHIFGITVYHGSLFTYAVSLSVILQVIILPYIGALADYTGRKKELLLTFAYIGSIAAMLMFFIEGTNYMLGSILLVISNLSYGASVVLYNAYLNDICPENERDSVSSTGFAMGYVGGGILLALNLVLVLQAESFGMTTGLAVRISMCSAGLWWAIFTLFPAFRLRKHRPEKSLPEGENIVIFGFKQLGRSLKDMANYPLTIYFLIAYLIYNDGVQTVIVVASQFGQEALGLSIGTLTSVILMVQFVAFAGAKVFNFVANKVNTLRAILISLVIWTLAIIYAFTLLHDATGFFILAAVVGLVLGGTQALSRSLFSLLIPAGKEGEYFGIYEISERGTSWIGTLAFGLSLQWTNSYHSAIFTLIIFFIIGFLLLMRFNVKKAVEQSGNIVPKIFR